MSTCPHCYTGTCKRHKLQDNGRSLTKSIDAESTLQKMYDQLVGSKLQKLQAEAEKDPSRQHTNEFRKKLDASREKSLRKSHKLRSKLVNVSVTGSGLNPQALAAIYGEDSNTSDEEQKKRKKEKKKRHKHTSTWDRKRYRSDNLDSNDDHSNESHHRHKKVSSSRKQSRNYKKSHQLTMHKSRKTDSNDETK